MSKETLGRIYRITNFMHDELESIIKSGENVSLAVEMLANMCWSVHFWAYQEIERIKAEEKAREEDENF